MDVEDLLQISQLEDSQILNIYLVGSRLYGTFTSTSDFDILIVAKEFIGNTNGEEVII